MPKYTVDVGVPNRYGRYFTCEAPTVDDAVRQADASITPEEEADGYMVVQVKEGFYTEHRSQRILWDYMNGGLA